MKNTSAKPSGPLRMSFSAATRLASIVSGSFTFSKPEKADICSLHYQKKMSLHKFLATLEV